MQFSHLSADHGQWIASACASADPSTVVAQIPHGFERYVRILHPSLDEDDQLVRWETVAQSRKHIITAADLFETVAGLDAQGNPETEDAWVDSDLPLDQLPESQWHALAAELLAASPQDQKFVVGLWAGYAFIEGGDRIQIEREPDPALNDEENQREYELALAEAQKPAFSPEVIHADLLELGGGYRNYHLFEADAEFLARPEWAITADGAQRQRPALAFAADHSWMLSTEPFDDCTILGGPASLIESILNNPVLEAIEVGQFTRIGHSN
ncbi:MULTISPECIES: hypothetical protein [Glutamicibacter]|uniref:hypothetical protein n=1 Tax=Glutamicibacter TaxID=1742989 RepID=UPI00195EC505|nr:hypothetical protein [Glutamicibacter nicotianae]MBM7768915.1 uncharacterized protein with PIN domain [Glutamicibacter nicotianae]